MLTIVYFSQLFVLACDVASFPRVFPKLFRRHDNFRSITEAAEKLFTILPAQPELGDVGEAESADNIAEKIGVGFVEVRFHHRALGPINQFRLADFAVQVISNFASDSLAGDFHRVENFTAVCGLNRWEMASAA